MPEGRPPFSLLEEALQLLEMSADKYSAPRAAGHDRCIIPVRPENVDAWLNPDPSNPAAQYAILDDRDRPYYEHRLAA